MKTALDCIPCLIRQAIDAARRLSPESDFHLRVTREILQWASVINLQDSPPALAQQIHRRLREATAAADPYGPLKTFHNQLAWRLLPQLEAAVTEASDPLAMATRIAIAGNVIDLGAKTDITADDVRGAIGNVLAEPFSGDITEALKHLEMLAADHRLQRVAKDRQTFYTVA